MPASLLDDNEEGEVDKASALYFPADYIDNKNGARCGDCKFFGNFDCEIVAGRIEPDGVCGLFVKGILSKQLAGYITDGPTHCGNCKFFDDGDCSIVKGKVDFGGCCNFWEGE